MNNNEFTIKLQLSLKRAIDITAALLSLVLLSPFLLLIAISIRLDSPGPVIYRHRRVGKDGRLFDLYKFRTMVCGGDDSGYMEYLRELIESAQKDPAAGKPYTKMQDDCRVTWIGSFLRNSYLDELPQMMNILKGDLSLVGPRPHIQLEVDHYTAEQRRRLTVKPGMTGLWQVDGKADFTFAELLACDLDYIDNWSLKLDLYIIFKTVLIMLRGGEKFWTRTNKLIPSNPRNDISRRPPRPPNGKPELPSARNGKWHGWKLPAAIRRHLPGAGEHDLDRISTIKD